MGRESIGGSHLVSDRLQDGPPPHVAMKQDVLFPSKKHKNPK